MSDFDFLQNKIIRAEMEGIFSRYDIKFWQRFQDKTVLVSGAYGMLASYLVYFYIYLNEIKGIKVKIITLSKSEGKLRERFGVYPDRDYFENFTHDILKPLSIEESIHCIVHAASIAEPKYFIERPADVVAPNMVGTLNLLELAKEKKCESFLFFSSSAVYDGNTKNDTLFLESECGYYNPSDIRCSYALSKAAGELLSKSYCVQWGIPCKIIRIENALAPTINLNYGEQAIQHFLKSALDGNDIYMQSLGQSLRSYVFGVDSVCAYVKILLDGESGETYNLSNPGEQLMLVDAAQIIADIAGVRLILPSNASPQAVKRNLLSNNKLRSLGWSCTYSVKEGFSNIIASHKERIC